MAHHQVVHDTLRFVVHDSTLVRQTLEGLVQRIPSIPTVHVRMDDSISVKDLLSWGIALAGALGAAFGGALIAGALTRQASAEAIKNEWQLERDYAINQLRLRVVSNLKRAVTLGGHAAKYPQAIAVPVTVHEELEVLWNTYYRVSGPVFGAWPEELAERVDRFFVDTHNAGEEIKVLEQWKRNTPDPDDVNFFTPDMFVDKRNMLLRRIADLGTRASELLREVKNP